MKHKEHVLELVDCRIVHSAKNSFHGEDTNYLQIVHNAKNSSIEKTKITYEDRAQNLVQNGIWKANIQEKRIAIDRKTIISA